MIDHGRGQQPPPRRIPGAGVDPRKSPGHLTSAEQIEPPARPKPAPPPEPEPLPPAKPEAEPKKAVPIEVAALYDGWPVVLKATLDPDQVPVFLKRLEKRGYRRPAVPIERTPDGAPICPRHHVPMREREKQGDTWHSHTIVDPATGQKTYCKGYHGKDSPGFDL